VLDEQFHDATDADLLFVVEVAEPSRNSSVPSTSHATTPLCHIGNNSSRVII
jgi:hypothetical protein